jgi:hypothetical protein
VIPQLTNIYDYKVGGVSNDRLRFLSRLSSHQRITCLIAVLLKTSVLTTLASHHLINQQPDTIAKMSEILVGEYLFRRLKEIGIDTIFGVPGGLLPLHSQLNEQ